MAEFEDNFEKEIKKLTQEQIDNYYQKDITDGLSNEQRAYLYFAPDAELYAEVMGDYDGPAYDAQTMDRDIPNEIDEEYAKSLKDKPITDGNISDMDDIDRLTIDDWYEEIEVENNIPKGSISKLGLALDPIAEGLEFALKGIGLGSVAQWWVKAEAANFLAGLIRGAGAASGVAQLGQSQALMGKEITGDSEEILNAFKTNLGQQMKLSPSLWLENKYAQSSLGKGKTPTEQGYSWAKNALGFGK